MAFDVWATSISFRVINGRCNNGGIWHIVISAHLRGLNRYILAISIQFLLAVVCEVCISRDSLFRRAFAYIAHRHGDEMRREKYWPAISLVFHLPPLTQVNKHWTTFISVNAPVTNVPGGISKRTQLTLSLLKKLFHSWLQVMYREEWRQRTSLSVKTKWKWNYIIWELEANKN